MGKRKTVFIAISPNLASINNFFIDLANSFQERGFTVVVIFDKQKVRELNQYNLIYEKWPSWRPTKFRDLLFLRGLIKKYSPSHIIANFGSVNICLIGGFLFGVKHRIAWNHTKSEQMIKDAQFGMFKLRLLQFRKMVITNLFATRVLTNSNDTRLDIVSYLKYPKNKIKVIYFLLPNIINDYKLEKEKVITFVSRFSPSKGHRLFLEAVVLLSKKFPDYKYYLVGKGDTVEEVKGWVKELKIVNFVEFLGHKSQKEVYKILATSKLHVSASKDEAFGMINLESIALGTPIIAQEVGGIKEILENNVNGYFFNQNDSNDLYQKIAMILNDENLYERLRLGTKDVFENKFLLNEHNLDKNIDLILN